MLNDQTSSLSTQFGFKFSDYGAQDHERFRSRLREIFPEGSDVNAALEHLRSSGADCRMESVVLAADGSVRLVNPATGLGVPGPRDVQRPEAKHYARAALVHHCAVSVAAGSAATTQYGVSLFADQANRLVRLTATIGTYGITS
jgi:hypothetical protein